MGRVRKASYSFKVDFSNAMFSEYSEDGCGVSGFTVNADRYDMDPSIYGTPSGEIGWFYDDYEVRQRIIEKYERPYPERDYSREYTEEEEAEQDRLANEWEVYAERFESTLDSTKATIDGVKISKLTLRCKPDGVGAFETDADKECKVKVHVNIQVPDGPMHSEWVALEGNFYPSDDVISFMEAYADEMEEEALSKAKDTIRKEYYADSRIQQVYELMGDIIRMYNVGDYERYADRFTAIRREFCSVADDLEMAMKEDEPLIEKTGERNMESKDGNGKVRKHRFSIYQYDIDRLNDDEDYRRRSVEANLGERDPDASDYLKTYEYEDENDSLDSVFEKFNVHRPSDFMSYSLSVGDVVVRDGKAYMVDRFGFKEIPGFGIDKSRKTRGPVVRKATRTRGPIVRKACGAKTEKEDSDIEDAGTPAETAENPPTADEGEEPVSEPKEKPKAPQKPKEAPAEDDSVDKSHTDDPYELLDRCIKAQGTRNGLTYTEVAKICGYTDPNRLLSYFARNGSVQRMKASDGWLYRFEDRNRRI